MNRYTEQLIALQPPGKALPTDAGSNWVKLLDALAQELDRVHGRMDVLTNEITLADSAAEMLDAWERALGLPDPCAPAPTDPDLRLTRIRTKLAEVGGQSAAYFIALAAGLGLSAEIIPWKPFEMGVSGMGDPVGGSDQRLVWQMNFPGEPDAERLALIKCIVRNAAPAHTVVVFSIGGSPEAVTHYYNGQFKYDQTIHFGA